MLKFGSVFRHRESLYVYLGSDDEIIYAARMLDAKHTNELIRLSEMRARTPEHSIHQGSMYCFVILTTAEFNERAAWLHKTDEHGATTSGIDPHSELCAEDIEELKTQILEDGIIPEKLKKIVKISFGID